MFEIIWSLLEEVWDAIKKFFLKIVSFIKNIVSFFKDPNRIKKLQEDQSRIAISIKEKLDNGDYNIVNCLFDKQEEKLVTPETDCEVITTEELDKETITNFGNKNMIILG